MARARKTDTEDRSESTDSPESAKSEELESGTQDVEAHSDASDGAAARTAEPEQAPEATDEAAPEPETVAAPEEPEPALESDRTEAVHPAGRAEGPRGGGFLPLALGGAVAAGLGFGAATYVLPDLLGPTAPTEELSALNERLAVQDGRVSELLQDVAALRSELEGKAGASAFSERSDALDAGIVEVKDALGSIDARLGEQADTLNSLDTRLTELEKRPVASGAASASALEAFGREMEAMRSEIAAQRASVESAQQEIEAAAQAASDRMAAIAAEAEQLREEAADTAKAAAVRAALTRLRSALDSGAALDPSLADLKAAGVEVPAALAEQSQGVPTQAALREAFPPAARDALGVSLRETVEGDAWDRIGAFLRSQTGARSLSPRAGDDPDAVLSRAEAALRAGDLEMAVSEIGLLPPEGQARMAEWVALAQRRLDAMQAVADISRAME